MQLVNIERDYDAVKAGLTLKWSQGPVERAVNKLKLHKTRVWSGWLSLTAQEDAALFLILARWVA